eukprot:7524299-Pyramimonas_sp.AAC.1
MGRRRSQRIISTRTPFDTGTLVDSFQQSSFPSLAGWPTKPRWSTSSRPCSDTSSTLRASPESFK